jgi:tetratricopeptide (TPR) repeat protein
MRKLFGVGIATVFVALFALLYDLRSRKSGDVSSESPATLEAHEVKDLHFTFPPSTAPAEAAFQRGVAAFNGDDAEAAADAFEEAVRLAPTSPEAHINLGLVYTRLNRMDDAIRELETALALKPESPPALLGIARCYVNKGNVQKALELFRRVVLAAPGSPEANEARSFIKHIHES